MASRACITSCVTSVTATCSSLAVETYSRHEPLAVTHPRLRDLSPSDLRDDGGLWSAENVRDSSGADCPGGRASWRGHPAPGRARPATARAFRTTALLLRWALLSIDPLRTNPPARPRLNGAAQGERHAFAESIVHMPASTPGARLTLISKLLRASSVQSRSVARHSAPTAAP